jgi:hypothetical protein|nr:MAG TPA: hypothetical protein [Caudoviricetes sp.]
MKKNRKNYEMMANGWLETLKDYEPWRYSVMEYKTYDSCWENQLKLSIAFINRHYSDLEDFLTSREVNARAAEIWKKEIPYRVKRVSMAYWESGVTKYNIVRSIESFTKIFQEISRFFSWNGNENNDVKVTIGNTLEECIGHLNEYFQTIRVIHYSGPERVIPFIIALSKIVKDLYLQGLPSLGRRILTREEYKRIASVIENIKSYPEYHTKEDKDYIKRLPFDLTDLPSKLFDMELSDTGLDTMYINLTNKTSNIDKYIDELEKMEERWRSEYNENHPYTPSSSNAHAYQLESSYDLFSDD